MKNIPAVLAILSLPLAACVSLDRSRDVADPAVSGHTLAMQVCSACHGVTGNSVSPNFPRLAAQPADYIVSQLKAFRDQQRSDPAGFEYMWGISRHLSDAQIQALGDYYTAQPIATTAPGAVAAGGRGQQLFEAGNPSAEVPACKTCHGESGEGSQIAPRIAGQHADYIVKQLGVFQRTDERPNGALMKVVSHGLTQSDMVAVAAYLETYQGSAKQP